MASLSTLQLVVSLCLLFLSSTVAQTPIQQRIALTPAGMTVSWSTVGPINVVPTVAFGLSPTALTSTASGATYNYNPSITWFHHVVLTGLSPSTTYYWTVTSPVGVNSSVLSFITAPVVGDRTPYNISINGDMGIVVDNGTLLAMQQAVSNINLFWHVGDLNYADDSTFLYQYFLHDIAYQNATYETVTEQWMTSMTPLWNQKPYMVLPGNHEATCNEAYPTTCPAGQRNFTSYLLRYRMPYAESGGINNMWSSFDYGLVHYISIDTEVAFPNSPEGPGTSLNAGPFGDQLTWLKNDLIKANANRAKVPWILVSGHRPFYASGSGTWAPSRVAFEPLFIQYNVDIVWWERMWPTINGTATQHNYTDATAPMYIISASGGNPEGLSLITALQNITAFIDAKNFGWGQLTVVNETRLIWRFFFSANNSVMDSAVIDKPQRWAALQTTTPSVLGDPMFTGLMGQSYQIHGLDGAVYNLITDAQVQVNAQFRFLNSGECLHDEVGKPLFLCWSHPGSYLTALGVQVAGGSKVELIAGPARVGYSSVRVGNETLKVGSTTRVSWNGEEEMTVTAITERLVAIKGAGLYSLKVENSDGFLNLLELRVASMKVLTEEVKSHGLIGQSWQKAVEGKEVKEVEGFVDDYAEKDSDLMGCSFLFNRFDC